MTVTREQLNAGLTYQAYKDSMTRNRERLEANERSVAIDPADLAVFKNLPEPLEVLVIVEDWCGDVIANLPIVGRLAADSGKLNLHCFARDQHDDLMSLYLKEGKYKAIPVFAFFDQNMNELGSFLERPDSVTNARAEKRAALHAAHPEYGQIDGPIDQLTEEARLGLQRGIEQIRTELAPFANAEVIRELRAIVERAPARA